MLDRLLELNHQRYAEEVRQGLHGKPKAKGRRKSAHAGAMTIGVRRCLSCGWRSSARELRDEIEELIRDDLIGPIGGPEEELDDAPVDRYVLGLLAPRFSFSPTGSNGSAGSGQDDDEDPIAVDALPEDGLADGGVTADSGEEGTAEERPPAVDQLVPSSFGMTFALDGDCEELQVDASWGAYARQTSEQRLDRDGKPARVWRRRQCGGEVSRSRCPAAARSDRSRRTRTSPKS